MKIIDHGEMDFLTPELSETDKAIARKVREAIHAHRNHLNEQAMAENEQAIARELGCTE